MLSCFVISRSTLRRTANSHFLCVLPRSTRVAFPFSGRLPLTVPSKSFPLNSFADPHPLNSVVSYRYKNIGWPGYPLPAPPLATHHSPLHSSPFFSYFCALFCTCSSLNSFVFKRFRTLCQKSPWVGGRGSSFLRRSDVPTFQRFNVSTFKRSASPIAAKRRWCNNSQRHGLCRQLRETYRPETVSKTKRADIGESSILVPFASRA
jgi:hypothetical protein